MGYKEGRQRNSIEEKFDEEGVMDQKLRSGVCCSVEKTYLHEIFRNKMMFLIRPNTLCHTNFIKKLIISM